MTTTVVTPFDRSHEPSQKHEEARPLDLALAFTLLYFTLLYVTLLYFTFLAVTLLYFILLHFNFLAFTLLYSTLFYWLAISTVGSPVKVWLWDVRLQSIAVMLDSALA